MADLLPIETQRLVLRLAVRESAGDVETARERLITGTDPVVVAGELGDLVVKLGRILEQTRDPRSAATMRDTIREVAADG